MIKYKLGNILEVKKGVIIHGCNAKGVMNSGVAKAIRDEYPKVYDMYKRIESEKGLRLGAVQISNVSKYLQVVNAITQENYGRDHSTRYVSYGAIHLAFERLNDHYPLDVGFNIPKIGAGLGNGDWNTISFLIELACPGRALVCWEL